jgi:thymidylate kinase
VLYIVEGVAGSGKDTLVAQLLQRLRPEERHVRSFPEEAVLASWLHYIVPGIHETRLQLARGLVEHARDELAREPETVFVFNRFHVSHAVWRQELRASPQLEDRHRELVEALSTLPVLILQTVLDPAEAEARASHFERAEVAWRRHLARRLETHGQASAGASFLAQQDAMSRIIERDGLPHRRLPLGPGSEADIDAVLAGA